MAYNGVVNTIRNVSVIITTEDAVSIKLEGQDSINITYTQEVAITRNKDGSGDGVVYLKNAEQPDTIEVTITQLSKVTEDYLKKLFKEREKFKLTLINKSSEGDIKVFNNTIITKPPAPTSIEQEPTGKLVISFAGFNDVYS